MVKPRRNLVILLFLTLIIVGCSTSSSVTVVHTPPTPTPTPTPIIFPSPIIPTPTPTAPPTCGFAGIFDCDETPTPSPCRPQIVYDYVINQGQSWKVVDPKQDQNNNPFPIQVTFTSTT